MPNPPRSPALAAALTAPAPPEPGRLLLVEPDPARRQQLMLCLRAQGHSVQARDRADDLSLAARQGFELVLLNPDAPMKDTRQRGDDAWWQLRGLRHDDPRLPVIVLWAAGTQDDRAAAARQMGADEVVDTTVTPRELQARVDALLRRQREQYHGGMASAACAGWLLDCQGQRVQRPDGRWVALRKAEYRLLRTLMQHPGQALGHDTLRQALAGTEAAADGGPSDHRLRLLVARLRHRLGDHHPLRPVISTLPGVGHCFHAERLPMSAVAAARLPADDEPPDTDLGALGTGSTPLPEVIRLPGLRDGPQATARPRSGA